MVKIMFSGRFDGGEKEKYLRQTAAELGGLGYEILVVEAGAGDSYGPQTMEYLYQSDIVVAMVCDRYGELTKSPYCSYAEVKYFIDKQKCVIPIQLYNGEWPPEPEPRGAAQNHFFFTGDRVKVMAINKDGELMSAKKLAELISQAVRKLPAKEPVAPATAKKEDHKCHRARTEELARQKEEEEHRLRQRAKTLELDRKKEEEEQRLRKEEELARRRREQEDEKDEASPQKWYNFGVQGGGHIQRRLYTAKECFEKSLAMDPSCKDAWNNLGFHGGGTVGRETYSKSQCFEQALAIDPSFALGWHNLGLQGGGHVGRHNYSEKQCYEEALAIDPNYRDAWSNLGYQGGGRVGSDTYSKTQCYEKALCIDPSFAVAWHNLGGRGGGTVNGRFYSKDECMAKSSELQAAGRRSR